MLINTSERIIFVLKIVMRINPPTKIYLDKSPIHGIGVFASNKENNTFEFYALREIEKGEEILVYYGSEEYWDMIKRVKEENR